MGRNIGSLSASGVAETLDEANDPAAEVERCGISENRKMWDAISQYALP
jgi:hypothetical protein